MGRKRARAQIDTPGQKSSPAQPAKPLKVVQTPEEFYRKVMSRPSWRALMERLAKAAESEGIDGS